MYRGKAHNNSGLHVMVTRITKQYQTGIKITNKQMAMINVPALTIYRISIKIKEGYKILIG